MKDYNGFNVMVGVSNTTITNGQYAKEYGPEEEGGDGTMLSYIEVFVPCLTPNAEGEPSSTAMFEKVEITNPLTGKKAASSIPKFQTIKCLFMGAQNMMVPCIHKGEQVYLLQYEGGNNNFYWLPMGRSNDEGMRHFEHLRWYAMDRAKSLEDDENGKKQIKIVTDNNTYFIDINTNKDNKCIWIRTSQSDGEKNGYNIRILPEEQKLEICDDNYNASDGSRKVGNYLYLDSKNTVWKMWNVNESYLELNKENITMDCKGTIKIHAGKDINIDADNKIHVKAPTFENLSDNQMFTGASSSTKMSGSIAIVSPSTAVSGDAMTLKGAITVTGDNFTVGSAHGVVPCIILYGSSKWIWLLMCCFASILF